MKRIRRSLDTLAGVSTPQPTPDGQTRDRSREAHAAGDVVTAWTLWRQQPAAPFSSLDLLLVAEGAVRARSEEASRAIAALATQRPAEAALLRAQWASSESPNVEAWQDAVEAVRGDPWVHEGLMQRSLAFLEVHADPPLASAMFDALAAPLPGHLADHQRRLLRLKLASLSGRFGELCVPALADMEPYVPWTRPILELRVQCYEAAGHTLAHTASDDLRRFDRQDFRSLGELVRQGMARAREAGSSGDSAAPSP